MKKKTIGIVGGGQLGRMLAEAGQGLGFRVVVLDPTPNSPAGQVADRQIVGDFRDMKMILKLAQISDYVTYDIESTNTGALRKLEFMKIPVNPSSEILETIRDKFGQKNFLLKHGILVADFVEVDSFSDATRQAGIFGYPFLLKSRHGAYDGRGNFLVKNKSDISKALKKLGTGSLYAERFVPFDMELAVVSARDTYGKIISYPVVETVHKNNICHIVRSPAPISIKKAKEAKALAQKILKLFKVVGVMAVEMFLEKNGKIVVNEIAPRVHNSGHHTIEAFNVSQFEQHMRAISMMHLRSIKKVQKCAVMVNILGRRNGKVRPTRTEEAKKIAGTNVHIYGKMETRKERKMGHITVLGNNLKDAERRANKARKLITI